MSRLSRLVNETNGLSFFRNISLGYKKLTNIISINGLV